MTATAMFDHIDGFTIDMIIGRSVRVVLCTREGSEITQPSV